MTHPLVPRLERYLEPALSVRDVEVSGITQYSVGSSRATYGFDVDWTSETGQRRRDELVLRLDPLDPDGSLVPSNMAGEYNWYRTAFESSVVPVPEPILLEEDHSVLGADFMIMRRIPGHSDWETLFRPDFDDCRDMIAEEAFEVLGKIAALDISALDHGEPAATVEAENCWSVQLDYWNDILRRHELAPMPVTRAAIRLLRRLPPKPPCRTCISHGDFRFGNFMYDRNGVVGVLDWEMAHLGDPHEDLAWTSLQNFRPREPDHIWSLIEQQRAFAIWEAASGIKFDPKTFAWWQLFAHVKAVALWVKAAHAAATGKSDSVRYVFINWSYAPNQESWMVEAMQQLEEFNR